MAMLGNAPQSIIDALLAKQPSLNTPAPVQGDPAPVAPQQVAAPSPVAPDADPNGDMSITGWSPHKTSTLGKIGDIALAALGLPIMPFHKQTKQRNLEEAMTGFTEDPLGTIRKMSRIPGMEKQALALYNQYEQIHKNDAEDEQRVQYYKGMNEDRARGILSSYYGAFGQQKDPDAAYQKMLPTLRNFAAARGLPAELLPDKYDPDIASSVMVGGVKPEDQMRINETADYHNTENATRLTGLKLLQQYRENRLGQMNQSISEQHRHNLTDEGIARDKANRGGPEHRSFVDTKYGRGEIAKDGQTLTIKVADPRYTHNGDGNVIYDKVNGQWRLRK
jgi:hypothetical protein